ncbi:restriction endonuclease subunit S [Thermaurantiacus tibetensis]|uniref:restriction endonuclease subunit S n=1 Tax=Thermaurantiacus tibetensis TaxID=2759035 RepID=UPI00188EE340|nr:restriction endonuclease subunit S [Thermaurantiacus tibetensis]
MNAERLLALYERVADAPDAIARLRRFVLDLAVRGRLVPQDPNDEPASELLKRIAAEKARLVKAGEISKAKALPPVDDDPFVLPANWRWVRIREIASDRGQRVPDRDFTYIDVTSINKEVGVVANPKILSKDGAPSRARKAVRKGDVLYSCVRPYLLNVAVLDQDFDPTPIASTAFAVLNGHGLVEPRYIWIVLRSPFMVECVEESQRGQAYPAINDADFAVLPFPLPPLAEQRRIVAKVEELMALLDRLEAARQAREATRDRFTAATLARLTAPEPQPAGEGEEPATPPAADVEGQPRTAGPAPACGAGPGPARFALDALGPLTTRPDQVKALRQTILNLAVRGRLVPQDPNDEPASELLKRIAAEKARLVKAGEHRPDKLSWAGVEAEIDSRLPTNWACACLAEVTFCLDHRRVPVNGAERDARIRGRNQRDLFPYYGATQQQGWIDDFLFDGEFVLLGEDGVPFDDPLRAKAYVIRGRCWVNNHAHVFQPVLVLPEFVAHYLNVFDYSGRVMGATRAKLNQAQALTIPVPLPPLAEQRRIVAKVEELMALCDALEAALVTASTTRTRLLSALLHEALAPAPAEREAAQ